MRAYAFKGLCLLAVGVILAQFYFVQTLFSPIQPIENRPVATWSPTIENAAVLDVSASDETTGDILARPIFAPTRKPFVAPQVVVAEAEAPPPVEEQPPEPAQVTDPKTMSLKGIFVSGAMRSGLIASPEVPDGKWYTEGTTVMGWKIERFQDDSAILKQGEETFSLKQYVDNSQLPLGPAAPPQ
jgi:hypothetical protein